MQYFYKKRAIIDESADTLPYVDGIDAYSATKRIAEELVLGADNTDNLRTIAVRPAAIYGEGETRHLPRIIKIVRHYILSRPSIITSNLYSSPPCYQSQLSFFSIYFFIRMVFIFLKKLRINVMVSSNDLLLPYHF